MTVHLLDTYDPDWEARWEEANARLEALKPGLSAALLTGEYEALRAEYDVHLRALHAAFHAQFRTVDQYRDHRVEWFSTTHRGEEPAIVIPYGLTMAELDDHLGRADRIARDNARDRERPEPRDPPGLAAFRSPAPAGVQRHVERLEMDVPRQSRPVRCLLAVEATPDAAHLCFIWLRDGGGVCAEIEVLATRVYRERLRHPRGWRWLLGGYGRGEYRPSDVAFYEYDPVRTSDVSRDEFARVRMRWDRREGFVDPDWHTYPSTPVWLAEVADCPPGAVTIRASTAGPSLPPPASLRERA